MALLQNLTIQSSAKIATGNSLQRSTAAPGRIRQNSTHSVIEYANTTWHSSKIPEGIVTRGLTVNINGYDTNSYPNSGLTVINSASPGNNATLTSGQVYTPSDPGHFSFNGSTYSTSVPHSSLTSFSGSMTASCWFYINAYPGVWVRVVGKGLSTVRNYGLWYHPSGYWMWQRYGTAKLGVQYNGTTLPNQWVNLVGVSRGTTHELYLNGVLVATTTLTSTFNTDTEPLLIGRMADTTHAVHNGFISSVLVYNRGLSSQEVLYNYNQQAGRHFK